MAMLMMLLICVVISVHSFHFTPLRVPMTKPTTSHSCNNNNILQLRVTRNENDDQGEEDINADVYDITQNLFPENRRINKQAASSFPSAFRDGEKKEMNDRRPPPLSTSQHRKEVINNRASALYQKIQSQRRKKEQQSPPSKPRISKKTITKSTTSTTSHKKEDDDVYDITQSSFPEQRRDKSSFQRRELSEMDDPNPRWTKSDNDDDNTKSIPKEVLLPRPNTNTGSVSNNNIDEESYLDITSKFPKDRPSLSVNTGTLKERTTSGTYYDEKRQSITSPSAADADTLSDTSDDHDSSLDISSNFPSDRPSTLVNTGTKRREGPVATGSYYGESNKKKSTGSVGTKNVDIGEEDESFDITKQHFVGDRQSFVSRVNSGTLKRRGTTAGQSTSKSYEGAYRDVARNFSSNRASLLGHPKPRKLDKLDRAKARETADGYLNKHRFTSKKLSPPPVNIAPTKATNRVWREGDPSSAPTSKSKKNEEYLDTPRPFLQNLDLVPSSIAKSVANESRGTEADKFLDARSFSYNLDSTKRKAVTTPSQTGTQERQEAPFLDKPRVFQSNVDMRTSNLSGAKAKHSSEIPPEEKQTRDHYDITTSPMSNVDEMGQKSVSRNSRRSSSSDNEAFDITRAPLSNGPLERTSSVVRDAQSSSKVGSKEKKTSQVAASSNTPSRDDQQLKEKEGPSYDEVMYWLLTHLPNLQEEDAISYFHQLLEDGFDNIDMLQEQLVEDDLLFMKKAHRRALLRSVSENIFEEEEDGESNGEDVVDQATLKKGDVESTDDAWLDEQNRLVEERLAARLTEEKADNSCSNGEEKAQSTAKEDAPGEQYEDITRSSFVQTPTHFADRQSLSSVTTEYTISNSVTSRNKRSTPEGDELEEEAFDITRDSFPDRPSLSSANAHHETPTMRERSRRKSKEVDTSRMPLTRDVQIHDDEDVTPPSSPITQNNKPEISTITIAPRAELHQYYVEKGFTNEQAQRLKDYFTVWSNGAKSHELKFTAVFTCPLSGEHFASGNQKHSGEDVVVEDKTYWYRTKKQAMNAAASRALDCFSMRDCDDGMTKSILTVQRCENAPYLKGHAPSMPKLPEGVSLPTELIT